MNHEFETLYSKQRRKLQDFYNEWVKPIKHCMTPDLLEEWNRIIDKYNLETE